MQRRMPERESAARRPPHSKNPQDYLKPILAKQPDRVKGIRGRSLASTHERGEGVGGARRNRTADNGFADHCRTTWRPRHRGKLSVKEKTIKSPPNLMRSGRGRLGESEAFPVQFCAQHFSCKLFCLAGTSSLGAASCATTTTGLAGGGGQPGLGGECFVDDGRADEVAPFGPRTVIVTDIAVAEEILQDEPGVR